MLAGAAGFLFSAKKKKKKSEKSKKLLCDSSDFVHILKIWVLSEVYTTCRCVHMDFLHKDNIFLEVKKKILKWHTVQFKKKKKWDQWSWTPGSQPGTSPWVIWYRATAGHSGPQWYPVFFSFRDNQRYLKIIRVADPNKLKHKQKSTFILYENSLILRDINKNII